MVSVNPPPELFKIIGEKEVEVGAPLNLVKIRLVPEEPVTVKLT